MKRGDLVTFGCGSQLAELLGLERKYDTDGYRIIPLDNGMTGDGAGHAVWVQRVRAADMSTWRYNSLRNTWTRQP